MFHDSQITKEFQCKNCKDCKRCTLPPFCRALWKKQLSILYDKNSNTNNHHFAVLAHMQGFKVGRTHHQVFDKIFEGKEILWRNVVGFYSDTAKCYDFKHEWELNSQWCFS